MSVRQAVRNPRSYAARLAALYRALLFDPERFYEEYVKRPGIAREAVLVGAVGLVGFLGAYYGYQQLMASFAIGPIPGDRQPVADQVNFQILRNVVAPVTGAYGMWIAFGFGSYAVSWLYSDRGGIHRMMKNAAWAMVPMVFANVLNAAAWAGTAYLNREEYRSLAEDHPDITQGLYSSQAGRIWESLANEPAVVATTVLGLVFVVWSGYILAQGVARLRDIEQREAYISVAVPVAVTILYIAYNLFVQLTQAPQPP